MWKKLLLVLLIAALVAAAGVCFWPNSRAVKVRRIVFVSIDTLRADHLSCYGYPRQTSPFMDELASNGVLFRRMISAMATTAPAHASMFTGLHTIQHGVLQNGEILDEKFITLAEMIDDRYETAGVVSTRGHFRPSNMHRGLSFFDEPPKKQKGYRRANDTIDAAITWVDDRSADEAFFLFVHLFDPHSPYEPPADHRQAITETTDEAREAFADSLLAGHHIPLEFYEGDRQAMLDQMDRYDGEVHFADSQLRRLFDHLQAKGLAEDTVWIITADHGEGLGNHNHLMHGKHIYNEQIHVPLIVYFSDGSFKGTAIDEPVEHADILPTVLELAGIDPAVLDGQAKPIVGASLVPLLSGEADAHTKRYAFSQRRRFDKISKPAPDGTYKNGEPGEKYAIQNKSFKYLYRTELEDELFDLRSDPYEMNNLIGTGLPQERVMFDTITQMVELFKRQGTEEAREVDEEALENLRSLGYTK